MTSTLRSIRPRHAAVAALALVALATVLVTRDEDHPYRVRVELRDASGLRLKSNVKVAGVKAGTVADMDVTKDDHAIVTLELDPRAAPIGAGARAAVRPVNLLGEKYVELDPGDVSRPAPDGATIPIARTGTPVELDDVLNALDPDTRARLRILVNEAGVALLGRGADANRLLAALPGTVHELDGLVAGVTDDIAALREAIGAGDRVLTSAADEAPALRRLVARADGALAPLAARRKALGATLRTAPGTLRRLTATLGTLDGAARALRPTARRLRLAAPRVATTLHELPPFAAAVTATLDEVVRTAPALTRLGRRATPVVRRAAPTAALLASTAADARPVTASMADGGGDDLLRLMENWARTITGRDGLGHVFRTHVALDTEVVQHALDRLGLDRARRRDRGRRRPARPGLPALTKPSAATPARPVTVPKVSEILGDTGIGSAVDTVGRVAEGLVGGAPKDDSGDRAEGLLDFLLAP